MAVRTSGDDDGESISGPAEELPAVVGAAEDLIGTVPTPATIADELGTEYGEVTVGFTEVPDELDFAAEFDRLPDAEARLLGRTLGSIQAQLSPSKNRQAYEVWLYNSTGDAKSLGAQVTDKNGTFQGAGPLPSNSERYKFIDVSVENVDQNRKHSGNSILRGQLDQLVVEEGHPRLETERHRRVVDPLHRVVDQHDLGVQAQRAVQAGVGAGPREVLPDDRRALVPVGQPARLEHLGHLAVRPVEEVPAVGGHQRQAGHPVFERGRLALGQAFVQQRQVLAQFGGLADLGVERVDLAVDPGAGEPLGLQLPEELDVLALATADDRSQDLEPGPLLESQDPVDDLLRRLALDGRAAGGAVGAAGAGVEQPEVVVHLGDRADRGSWIAASRLLVDGNRR